MRPILLRWGPLVIHSYAALVNLGLLIGGGLVFLRAQRQGIDLRTVADAALAAALGGLLLGRAAYVGAHWPYYAHHMRQAVRPWDGGLLWQGALVGGVMGVSAMAVRRGRSPRRFLDILTPGAASLAGFSWLACFMIGCAWGDETYPGQGLLWALSLDLPDLYGIRRPRVAVQLLGAAWSFVLLVGTLVIQRLPRCRVSVFASWLTLHSLGALGLGVLRADEIVSVMGWRVDQLANLCLSATGMVLLGVQALSRRSDRED